jgi:ribosomally synthesized peptide (two-chain TOMM family)
MTMDNLLAFRTTFMRAIAQAWGDREFKHALLQDPVAALRTYLDFEWPWPERCELKVEEAGGRYEWIGEDWVWAQGFWESLTMHLPLDPEVHGIPPKYQAMALADYYRQHSSLFDDDWGKNDPRPPEGTLPAKPGGHSVRERRDDADADRSSSDLVAPPLPTLSFANANAEAGFNSPAPRYGFVPPESEFTAFKVVLVAAISKAWRDDRFKEILSIDSKLAMSTIRGYRVPWALTFPMRPDLRARWQPPTGGQPSFWYNATPHTLKLYLPSKPKSLDSEPVALATYNATGAEYPFTCCC